MRRHLPQAGGTAGAREGHLGHRPSTLPPYLENFASRGALPRVRDVSTRRLSKSAPAGYCEACGPWVAKCRSLLHRPGPWHDETGLRGWVFDCARVPQGPLHRLRGFGQPDHLPDVGPWRLGKDLEQGGTRPQIALALGAAALRIPGRVVDEVFQLFAQDIGLIRGFRHSLYFNLWGHRITSVLT